MLIYRTPLKMTRLDGTLDGDGSANGEAATPHESPTHASLPAGGPANGCADQPETARVAPRAEVAEVAELARRVEQMLQHPSEWRSTTLAVGPLVLDLLDRIAHRGDRRIDLLPREFKLLEYIMRRPDRVITREELLRAVWRYRVVPETNLVDVHFGKLRRKVDGPGEPHLLAAIRGEGFLVRSDPHTTLDGEGR